jgi:predicted nucleic acid-binding protein
VILVDTSIWVDHLNKADLLLRKLLHSDQVLLHPLIIGELAMGNLLPREPILASLQRLPLVEVATDDEVLEFISRNSLHGRGIGFIDAHLLVAAKLTAKGSVWTRDKRLASIAEELAIAYRPKMDAN